MAFNVCVLCEQPWTFEYVVWTSRHILDFPLFSCHFISLFKAFSLHPFPSETSQDLPDPQACDEGKHLFLSFSLLRRPFVAKEEESVSTQHLNTTRYCFLSVSRLFPVSFLSCEWSAWMMRHPLTCVSQLWWFCFFVFTWTIFFFFYKQNLKFSSIQWIISFNQFILLNRWICESLCN